MIGDFFEAQQIADLATEVQAELFEGVNGDLADRVISQSIDGAERYVGFTRNSS